MESNLIKRFLLEQGYITGEITMYSHLSEIAYVKMKLQQLERGRMTIRPLDFDIWKKALQTNNILFGQVTKKQGFIGKSDIVEVALEKENSVCRHLITNVRKQVFAEDDEQLCNDASRIFDGKHLIMNGTYGDTLTYILSAADSGRFSVGICGDDNEYTKKKIEFYKEIKELLLQNGIEELDVVDENIGGKSLIYTLNYNCPRSVEPQVKGEICYSNR